MAYNAKTRASARKLKTDPELIRYTSFWSKRKLDVGRSTYSCYSFRNVKPTLIWWFFFRLRFFLSIYYYFKFCVYANSNEGPELLCPRGEGVTRSLRALRSRHRLVFHCTPTPNCTNRGFRLKRRNTFGHTTKSKLRIVEEHTPTSVNEMLLSSVIVSIRTVELKSGTRTCYTGYSDKRYACL